jgi:hypothetical protein
MVQRSKKVEGNVGGIVEDVPFTDLDKKKDFAFFVNVLLYQKCPPLHILEK